MKHGAALKFLNQKSTAAPNCRAELNASTSNHVQNEHDQSDDENNMNETAGHMHEKSETPQEYENDSNNQ
jgi:hypothetical protein